MFGPWLRHIVVFITLVSAAGASPLLTEIQDVLYRADGTLFDGIAQISWNAFQAPDGTEVPRNQLNIRVVRGSLRVSLVPTTTAIRPAYYTVRFNSDGKIQFTEFWTVPQSTAPLKLRDIRTQAPAVGNLTTAPVSVNIQDVPGLRTELDLRPARGAGWVPNRAAVIGSSGALEAVAGNGTDCVRVDGTSGPCGRSTTLIDGEIPSGAINGANTMFFVSAAPAPQESLQLFENGLLLAQNRDYYLSGNAITILPGRAPNPGDILQVWYRISGPDGTIVDSETPSGAVNGVNAVFNLVSPPLPAASLKLYRNGILQKAGADYSLSTNIVTFLPASIPQPGDLLQVSYRR